MLCALALLPCSINGQDARPPTTVKYLQRRLAGARGIPRLDRLQSRIEIHVLNLRLGREDPLIRTPTRYTRVRDTAGRGRESTTAGK